MLQQMALCFSNGKRNIEEKSLQEGKTRGFVNQWMFFLQFQKFLSAVQLSPFIYGAELIIHYEKGRLRELEKLLDTFFKAVPVHPALAGLNEDELNIVFLLVHGIERKMASAMLDIPEGTFKKQCTKIFKELGVSSVTLLVMRSEQEHWFSL